MEIILYLTLASVFVYLIVGEYVFLEKQRSTLHKLFGFMSLVLAFWAVTEFMYMSANSLAQANLWLRIHALVAGFAGPIYFHFTVVFTKTYPDKLPRSFYSIYIPSFVIAYILSFTTWVIRGPIKNSWGYSFALGNKPLFALAAGYSILFGLAGVALLLANYFQSKDIRVKKQSIIMAVGSLVSDTGIVVTAFFWPLIGINAPRLISIFFLSLYSAMAYAILKYELFEISPAKAADNILLTMTDSLVIIDNFGMVTLANQSMTKTFGYERDELIGRPASFIDLDVLSGPMRQKTIESIPLTNYDTAIRAKSGRLVPVLLSASVLKDKRGRTIGMVVVAKDITERKKADQKIHRMAYHDSLTSLPNRRLLYEHFAKTLAYHKRYKKRLAVLFIDLDNFKNINDTLGHVVGDSVLKKASDCIIKSIRENDIAARIGGDEFVVVLSDIARPENSVEIAKKILNNLSTATAIKGESIKISAKIGISLFPDDSDNIDSLIGQADIAMYQAKKDDKKSYQHYSPEAEAA